MSTLRNQLEKMGIEMVSSKLTGIAQAVSGMSQGLGSNDLRRAAFLLSTISAALAFGCIESLDKAVRKWADEGEFVKLMLQDLEEEEGKEAVEQVKRRVEQATGKTIEELVGRGGANLDPQLADELRKLMGGEDGTPGGD